MVRAMATKQSVDRASADVYDRQSRAEGRFHAS
jgi:hypothetical protein